MSTTGNRNPDSDDRDAVPQRLVIWLLRQLHPGDNDSIRMLPSIDLDVIKNDPKVFMGYSDSTICHCACFRAGLVSYYGPAIMAGFAENRGLFPYMERSVRQTLFASEP